MQASKFPAVTLVGSLAFDYIMDCPGRFREQITPEAAHVLSVSFLIPSMQRRWGGTAGNVAYNLALLGVRAEVCGAVGEDGRAYLQRLKKLGVGIDKIRVHKKLATAAAYIMTDKEDNQISAFAPGAFMLPTVIGKPRSAWTLLVASNPDDAVRLPRQWQKQGVRYIFDPAQNVGTLSKSALRSGIAGSALTIGNDFEMATMRKRAAWTQRELVEAAGKVITTQGAKGSIVEEKGKKPVRVAASKPRRVVDPTGAGDSYRAGLLYGLLQNFSLAKAAAWGGAVASFAIEQQGTQEHEFTLVEVRRRAQ